MAVFLAVALMLGTAHTDFDHSSEIGQNAAGFVVHETTENVGTQTALEASHDESCPSQSVCHTQQVLNAKVQTVRPPLTGNTSHLLPEFTLGNSRVVSLDHPPPIS